MSTYHVRGFSGLFSFRQNLNTLPGNYQRCGVYAEKGFMVEQPDLFTGGAWEAYEHMIEKGYTDQMVRDDSGNVLRKREGRKY
jgi:hypothetical protein